MIKYLINAYRQKWQMRYRTRKRRMFWNSIALLIFAPLLGWAAMEGPDGKYPVAEIVFGVVIALATAIIGVFALRWSLTADEKQA